MRSTNPPEAPVRRAGGDGTFLRRLNYTAVLRSLHTARVATVTELAREAKVSRATAEGIMDELLADGLAEDSPAETGDRQRGRPARRFAFRGEAVHVAGVSIEAAGVVGMVADLAGRIVATRRVPTHPDLPAADRLGAVVELVEAVAAEAGQTVAGLAAIGVGTTGVIAGDGHVVKSIVLSDWTGVPLLAALSAALPTPVLVENDMRLAVLAEHWRGAAHGYLDVIYLQVSTRIGLGLLFGGVPHRGAHAAAGELGGSPSHSWDAFRHVTDYAMAVEPGELRAPDQAALFALGRARAGDEKALAAMTAFGTALGHGLAGLVTPLDPEMVVIGGSLARAGALLVDPIQACLDDICFHPPRVVASELAADTVVLGSVRMALNHAERMLFAS
jgi:predicted NBD/HSP70 family sugar kinase